MSRDPSLFGRLYWDNAALLPGVSFSGGSWLLPPANLLDERLVSYPARVLVTGDPGIDKAAAVIEIALPERSHVWAVHLEHAVLPRRALWRVEATSGPGFTGFAMDSGWRRWLPRVHRSSDLAWVKRNWWLGTATDRELDAFGRRCTIYSGDRPWTVRSLRISIDPQTAVPGVIDLGYLMLPQSRWLPPYNYALGRRLEALPRDLVAETVSGYRPVEARRARRKHSINWSVLTKGGAFDLFDAAMQATLARPVLFVPEPRDVLLHFRQTFLGKFAALPPADQWEQMLWSSSAEIEEMLG